MQFGTRKSRGRALSITAIAAASAVSTSAFAAEIAENLLVDIDFTLQPLGALPSVANSGTLGGFFEATGGGTTIPTIANVNANGTKGLRLDGNDFMRSVSSVGGALLPAPAGITGPSPALTRSIEAWVFNPSIAQEETVVNLGRRGGPDGTNASHNYGANGTFGAIGQWGGGPDIGWNGAPAAGQWHLLTYTFDGTTTRVYADGVLKNSEPHTLNTHTGLPIQLGAQIEGDGTTVTGGLRGSLTLGKVRIHDGVLTDTQVLTNYTTEAAGFSGPLPALPTYAGLTHRYSFSNAPGAAGGAIIPDEVGTAHGEVKGANATFTGTRLALPGGGSATEAYVDLPNGLLSSNSANNGGTGQVTLEAWIKHTGNRSWARIFDFGNSTNGEATGPGGSGNGTSYLMLTAQTGGDVNNRRVELLNTGSELAETGVNTFNTDIHFAVTWSEATGLITYYENGLEVYSFVTNDAMSAIQDVNVWLGRSNWFADQNFQGEFDEFRMFNRVLSTEEVLGSYLAGPNAIPEPSIAAMLALGAGSLMMRRRNRR